MTKNILIVYYSDSGNTRKAAEYIANKLDAVMEQVKTPAFGHGVWGYFKKGWFSWRKRQVPIAPVVHDPANFDLLIVGAPVWAGHVASPIRSYLSTEAAKAQKAPRVAFFVTEGGSGGSRALQEMRELLNVKTICELEINDHDRKVQQDISMMENFVSLIDNSLEQGPQPATA
ncbi:flavodoxin family protein [Paremcibacter congregatus]|uniref:Flavodoxin n=1 Tax=Paremcibacter congregatus TaxID=2043170 RepID=A0A2G4YTX7_9PROT|nr:flavodoxin [Paremcibacter congregatus]PHZ85791.1 flavodoxin [Paremcibacter congregatus]QDE26754.1 flavodoxin [Paremcibacter congregatus]